MRGGVYPKVAQERLGHSTTGITLNIYSHVSVGMQRDAAEKVAGKAQRKLGEIKTVLGK